MSEYVTRDEAAELLEVSVRSVERYVEQGRLTKYKRGRYWVRLSRKEVQALKTEMTEVVAVAK
jgi:excisionase family DNA binding protein